MTALQVYDAVLIEMSKVGALSLKLREFNYYFNRAILKFVNKLYNSYDTNQITSDDMRVLKTTAYLTPVKVNAQAEHNNSSASATSLLSKAYSSIASLNGATYEAYLPIDYLHLLNCICVYYVAQDKDCYDAGSYIQVPATRLTADAWSRVIDDVYNAPKPMKPYFYIHNQNSAGISFANLEKYQGRASKTPLPVDPITDVDDSGTPNGTDMNGTYAVTANGFPYYTYDTGGGTCDAVIVTKEWMELWKDLIKNPTAIDFNDSDSYDCLRLITINQGPNDAYSKITIGEVLYRDGSCLTLTGHDHKGRNEKAIGSVDYVSPAKMFYPDPSFNVAGVNGAKKGSNLPRTFNLFEYEKDADTGKITQSGTRTVSLVEKETGTRISNPSNVRLEIRYGKDDTVFQLKEIAVDYIKSPLFIRLTLELVDTTVDTSLMLEFPDYICQEIINELVTDLMERSSNPRLATHAQINLSIARPSQAQQQPTPKA